MKQRPNESKYWRDTTGSGSLDVIEYIYVKKESLLFLHYLILTLFFKINACIT